MYSENRHYGHADILLTHCGLPPQTRIPVRIQHGWQPGFGMAPRHMAEPGRKLVWSSRNLARAEEAGYQDVMPVGAPYLYLPPLEDAAPARGPRSVLVVPFHGWEKEGLAGSMEGYGEALEELVAAGWGPITVCLYWFEYEQPAYREVFERRGFQTTTMGHRGDNPEFLVRQRQLIRDHAVATSNRISTAAFYALVTDRPFFLHGPPAGLSATDDPTGEGFDAWQRETFPTLTREAFERDGACQRGVGDAELGAEHRRDPAALRGSLLLGAEHAATRRRLRVKRAASSVARALRGAK